MAIQTITGIPRIQADAGATTIPATGNASDVDNQQTQLSQAAQSAEQKPAEGSTDWLSWAFNILGTAITGGGWYFANKKAKENEAALEPLKQELATANTAKNKIQQQLTERETQLAHLQQSKAIVHGLALDSSLKTAELLHKSIEQPDSETYTPEQRKAHNDELINTYTKLADLHTKPEDQVKAVEKAIEHINRIPEYNNGNHGEHKPVYNNLFSGLISYLHETEDDHTSQINTLIEQYLNIHNNSTHENDEVKANTLKEFEAHLPGEYKSHFTETLKTHTPKKA